MKKIIYRQKKADKVKKEKGGVSAKVILCSVIVAAVLYALLIFVEKSIVDSEATKQVYVSVKEVPENLLITAENIGGYFALMERPLSAVPDNAVENAAELYGKYTDRVIDKNEILTGKSFSSLDERTRGIEHPIEVSLNASSLSQMVGGVIRAGDYINIWAVKNTNINGESVTKTENICTHAYVTRTFTSSGEEASGNDKDKATLVINIIIPAEQEEEFNRAIVEGTVRVGRYMYDAEENE